MNMTQFNQDGLSFFLPVAKLLTTPMQRAEAMEASTAVPPFFKTRLS